MTDTPRFTGDAEDYAQAQWLSEALKKEWRYDYGAKKWHHWNGKRWAPDNVNAVQLAVASAARDLIAAGGENKKLFKLFNVATIKKTLEALCTFDGYGTNGGDWDQVPYLLGVENGVVDLRTNTLIAHPDPDCLVTRTTGCDFKPIADLSEAASRAPRFMTFLSEVMSEDGDMMAFLLLWFGSSLFGFSPEQRFLLMTGIGRNGKGALKHSVMKAVGEYGAQPDANVYMRSKMGGARSEGARADLMDLKGKRVTFFSEPEGNRFNEEMLKAHTGGDLITARYLYSNDIVSWEPTHSITFLVNNAPEVEDLGPSMGARVMVADFRERFDGEKEDKTLYRKLENEAEGILAILCWASSAWYASWTATGEGITLPDRVIEQSKAFMERNDVVAAALDEAIEADPDAITQASRLYEAYLQWHARSNRSDEAISQVKFSQTLERKGFRKVKRPGGMYVIGLRPMSAMEVAENEEDDDE